MVVAVALVGAGTAAVGFAYLRGGSGPSAPPTAQAAPAGTGAPLAQPAPRPRPGLQRDAQEGRELVPARVPEPLEDNYRGAEAYADALAAGDKNPGEKAFRADASAFFEHNLDLAQEKAAREGISLGELQELTFMGTLAMHLRQWEAVEQVLGHALSAEDRELGDKLIFTASNDFKAAIRKQVAEGASPKERWEAIRTHQASFVDQYRALTKLSPEQYDALLALPYAKGPGGAR